MVSIRQLCTVKVLKLKVLRENILKKYVSLVPTFQVQSRLLIGNSTSAVDTLQVFRSTFDVLVDENYSIGLDIER